jgi:hypothetical protein
VGVQTANLASVLIFMQGADGPMRLESEVRKSEVLEQHFVHGKWAIVKVYVRGKLREIMVRNREGHNS